MISENNKAAKVLDRLHQEAKNDYMKIGGGMVKSLFRPLQPSDFKHAYLPISEEQGRSLHELVSSNDCKTVIEFGTSFGISTIYLADAVRKTGGKVISTELLENKVATAKKNIAEAGLEAYVEIRVGDAMQTLQHLSEPIDFLFLDGWKNLYLPLFEMLEPLFHERTMIYADNMDMDGTRPYAQYVLGSQDHYFTQSVDAGKAYLTTIKRIKEKRA